MKLYNYYLYYFYKNNHIFCDFKYDKYLYASTYIICKKNIIISKNIPILNNINLILSNIMLGEWSYNSLIKRIIKTSLPIIFLQYFGTSWEFITPIGILLNLYQINNFIKDLKLYKNIKKTAFHILSLNI